MNFYVENYQAVIQSSHLLAVSMMDVEHNVIDLAMDVHIEFLKVPVFYIACHNFIPEVSSW